MKLGCATLDFEGIVIECRMKPFGEVLAGWEPMMFLDSYVARIPKLDVSSLGILFLLSIYQALLCCIPKSFTV